ncbi:5-oxopent-3-ene-1,2,5-tricarboxylate decarboxylase [Marinobacterium nitratireducens]|uniref:5-oxopent-3-ene-1,2,5-tricarboxylate decarboxylase n=1 Tax=Marinobacterium nitratireducens TaxID=518897 RepID=A0A918DRL3_9GAMM|nr:fumarylacetoacetate hydrolase family protein [Marinobacterium nitratireducens]GGO79594.1 5-oxopent-3-ene-1,2,5-tricarboxylate decarboxylase [Marinobacterium nitratireducens]
MRLITFEYRNQTRAGALIDDRVIDTALDPDLPQDMIGLLAAGEPALERLRDLAENPEAGIPLAEVRLLAPVPRPGKYLAVGLNYADHVEETGLETPEFPTFFNKQTTCVTGPEMPVHRPRISDKLDYEGELAIVIGRRCRHVTPEQAREVIAGYTIANDVSVRDWQIKAPTWTLGKSFDTHGPIGPWIVTADSLDPHNLELKTWLNDELRQHSNTRHLIFDCYQLVSTLSTVCTLEPGDIIATGTSSGVGVSMKPRGYMKAGDRVRVEIEGIGELCNPIVEEPDTACY